MLVFRNVLSALREKKKTKSYRIMISCHKLRCNALTLCLKSPTSTITIQSIRKLRVRNITRPTVQGPSMLLGLRVVQGRHTKGVLCVHRYAVIHLWRVCDCNNSYVKTKSALQEFGGKYIKIGCLYFELTWRCHLVYWRWFLWYWTILK